MFYHDFGFLLLQIQYEHRIIISRVHKFSFILVSLVTQFMFEERCRGFMVVGS